MITTKQKWLTILICLLLLLLVTGTGFFGMGKEEKSPNIESIGELKNCTIGGVINKMPDSSAKIFFESLLGQKLKGYQSYDNVFEIMKALKANEIQAAWFVDVSAKYLSETENGFRLLEIKDTSEPRLEFAMAVRKDDVTLRTKLNDAIAAMKSNGVLDSLIDVYITNAASANKLSELSTVPQAKSTLYVGVTGAVPPIDMVDTTFKPIGFSVAFMNQMQYSLNQKVEFVYVSNDTAFSNLMAGKIDVLFLYGKSQDTVGAIKNYAMTDGYYTMMKYSYLVRE